MFFFESYSKFYIVILCVCCFVVLLCFNVSTFALMEVGSNGKALRGHAQCHHWTGGESGKNQTTISPALKDFEGASVSDDLTLHFFIE